VIQRFGLLFTKKNKNNVSSEYSITHGLGNSVSSPERQGTGCCQGGNTVGGGELEIAASLVRDFWAAIEYGGVPEFLSRPRNRCHRLMTRWGEKIFLEASGNQRTWSSTLGLGAVAVATSPEIVPEMETEDQPDWNCDLLESRTAASVHSATIYLVDNTERSCGSPATGGTYT